MPVNMHRAIGDLKYKQSHHLSRPEQIISGDPDVTVTSLLPDDKFFLIACDGIWDCFSNEEVVSRPAHAISVLSCSLVATHLHFLH